MDYLRWSPCGHRQSRLCRPRSGRCSGRPAAMLRTWLPELKADCYRDCGKKGWVRVPAQRHAAARIRPATPLVAKLEKSDFSLQGQIVAATLCIARSKNRSDRSGPEACSESATNAQIRGRLLPFTKA